MDLVEMIEAKSFLGTEFATWLWFRSERDEGRIEAGRRAYEVAIESPLLLTSDWGGAQASALRGDAPTQAPEAAAALLWGKKVSRARLRLAAEGLEWTFTLNARTFDWSGLRLAAPTGLAFEENVAVRMEALGRFHDLFSHLFAAFLDLRLNPDLWEKELEDIREWIARKSGVPEGSHLNHG